MRETLRAGSKVLITAAVAALALAGCSPTSAGNSESGRDGEAHSILAEHGLDGLDPVSLVDELDRMPLADRPDDLVVSVRPDMLLVGSPANMDEAEPIALLDDQFYLSMAPFVDVTHACTFHSLTTCVGELQNEDITVRITDEATGEVLLDESTRTFDNGFIGYWLPADRVLTVHVEHDGRIGTTEVSTGADDPTCLTTLQLA
ncbi:CueP family metal-binding protein [Ruicaihuangia caeni]|uniref:CueP family metal-binding protein n=1 Tax=Ruicaihuangia caeni TaxID=3042517 RepID=UPI00338F7C06